jgi:signal transduction histidine kinase
MTKKLFIKIFFIIISLSFLALGLFGISRLHLHSDLPIQWEKKRDQILVANIPAEKKSQDEQLEKGDCLLKIDGYPIQTGREIDFVLDNKLPGEKVSLVVQRGEEILTVSLILIPRFNKRFIIINLLLGLLFWIVGVFVYLSKPSEKASRIFFWGCMTLSASILCNWPGYLFDAGFFGYVQQVLYLFIYPLVPALILYFTMIYPTEKRLILNHKYLSIIIFAPCLVFIILLEATYLTAIHLQSMKYYLNYVDFYNGFRIYLMLYLIVSIGFFIHSYKFSDTKESRDKIRWILWGMCVGAFPFLFLWTIPLVIGLQPFVREEVNYIFLTVVPLSFGFSIVKYQALDIEVVINRSIVYALVTGIIIALYLILVGITGHFLHVMSPGPSSFLIIIFTLVAAILFSPIKSRIQNFVDKTFYRVKYNYRLAIKDFSNAIFSAHDQIQLTDLILEHINKAIPIDRIALMLRSNSETIFRTAASQGMTEDDVLDLRCELAEQLGHLIREHRVPMIKPGRAEVSNIARIPENRTLDRIGVELIIPISLQEELTGLLVLGRKLSESKYSAEDIELLMTMANEGFMALERLKLQETMILERAEKEKLKELSDLKSEFISHVSHELRTPLTSIQWSVENLLDGIPEQPGPKVKEYLEGVHDSSQHLGRMIENLLDVSRIEAGRIEIFAEKLNVLDEVNKVLDILKPLADKKDIRLKVMQTEELTVKADRDRLRDILTNLLDNAIKYSNQGDVVEVELKIEKKFEKEMIVISIIDHGPGIPKEKQEAIFERFERIRKDQAVREKGLGLGLHIVKKLVELQGGRIWVESEVAKGSTFTFILPRG